jgi:hypothetical protein
VLLRPDNLSDEAMAQAEFIGSPVSTSLPRRDWLPLSRWSRSVGWSFYFTYYHVWFSDKGLSPHLQRAHAGRTQVDAENSRQ